MLKLATKHYLKSLGDKCFIANPDYIEWHDVKCVDLIIKRRPKWFWQHDRYFYDNFSLNDILDTPLPEDTKSYLKEEVMVTEDFLWNENVSIDEKLGGTIASLMSLDITGSDTVKVNLRFQNIKKRSIDFVAVKKLLESRKVNLASPYLQKLAQNKHNTICIVTQYIYIDTDTTLSATTSKEFGGDGSSNKAYHVKIEDDGKYSNSKTKSVTFKAGSRIAFDIMEFIIDSSGKITMVQRSEDFNKNTLAIPELSDSKLDNNNIQIIQLPHLCRNINLDSVSYDFVDASKTDISEVFKVLSALLKSKHRAYIIEHLIKLKVNDRKSLDKLSHFFLNYEQLLFGADSDTEQTKFDQFDEKTLKQAHLVNILKNVGVEIKKNEVLVDSSRIDSSLMKSIEVILDVLDELDIETIKYFDKLITEVKNYESVVQGLLILLYNSKLAKYVDPVLYERVKSSFSCATLILMSAGVMEHGIELTDKFDQIIILLNAMIR